MVHINLGLSTTSLHNSRMCRKTSVQYYSNVSISRFFALKIGKPPFNRCVTVYALPDMSCVSGDSRAARIEGDITECDTYNGEVMLTHGQMNVSVDPNSSLSSK